MKVPLSFAFLFMLSLTVWGQSPAAGLGPAAAAPPADYLDFLSAPDKQALLQKGELVVYGDSLDGLRLWKGSPFAETMQERYQGMKPSLAAECLFIIDRPAAVDDKELHRKISRSASAFSTMKGLQVYSPATRKMEPFILDAYRVESSGSRIRLDDPVVDPETAESRFVVYELEGESGDMYNEFVFIPHGSWFEVRIENLIPVMAGPFTLVDARKVKTIFCIYPTRDKVLMFGINLADTIRFLGIEKTKREAFSNRMRAIESWFAAGLQSNVAGL